MSAWSVAEVAGRAIPDIDPDSRAVMEPPHARLGANMECRRCACRGYVWANPANPGPSVAAHNATPGHVRWWARAERDWQGEERP